MLHKTGLLGFGGLALAALAGAAAAQTTEVVVPAANAAAEGLSSSTIPFAMLGAGVGRFQQVYGGSEFPSGASWIAGVAFRANGNTALAGRTLTVSLALSTTSGSPDGLSATFASNTGPDATIVYTGTLTLPPVAAAAGPAPFAWAIPFQRGFLYAGGNVLLDLTITSSTGGSGGTLDAVNVTGDPVSRAYNSSDPASPTTSTAPSTLGLVTRFDLVPATAPLAQTEPSISAASGGTDRFFMNGSGANAGRLYVLVGGHSGSVPGTLLPGGLTLPVNADATTLVLLGASNTSVLQNFIGILDPLGRAVATANVPPLDASVAGTTLTFGFLLANPFNLVSNPVSLSIAP